MAKYLSDNGYSVRIATRKTGNNFPDNVPANTSVMQLDYYSADQCNKAMDGVNTLIHLAGADANTYLKDPESMIHHHGELMESVVRAAKYSSLGKFIYFSTVHVYGNNLHGTVTEKTKPIPVSPYAKAHLEAENILVRRLNNVAVSIIRCSNLFGLPFFANEKCWKLVVNDFCKSAFQNGRLVINSSGEDYKDFIAVEDVVRAIHYLLKLNNDKEIEDIYNLGSSRTTSIIDIAKEIQKVLKDRFNYDCPIIKNKPSKEMNKPKHFILSTEKIKRLGFDVKQNTKELGALLRYCKVNY